MTSATLPPEGLAGLDPAWSRLVVARDGRGVERTWHVLDSGTEAVRGTLLCVHGNPTWSYLWRDLVARAPDGWRVVAVDQLEMGFSERTEAARDLAMRIDDLTGFTDAMSLDGPTVIVAHDWGGPVALGWALVHRAQLAGIVLTNTAVHQSDGSPAPSLIRAARLPGVRDAACVRTRTFLRGAIMLARPSLPDAVRTAFQAPYTSTTRRAGIGAFVADIPLDPDHRSAATLDRVASGIRELSEVPTLIVWGAQDPVFSDRYLHDLESRLPQAEVHRVPDAGHLVAEDVDLTTLVDNWLTDREVPGASAPDDGVAHEDAFEGTSVQPASLWAALEDTSRHDRPAIVEVATGTPHVVRFGELADRVRHLGAGMAATGVLPGHRVALLVTPGADLAAALYAVWRIGAVAVLADAGLGAKGITRALRAAAPDHLIGIPRALAASRALGWPGRRIAAGTLDPRLRRLTGTHTSLDELEAAGRDLPLPAPPGPDAVAAVAFTSGATGAAKGVVYRHRQLQAQRDALVRTYGIGPDDRLVAAFAPFALYGPTMGITSVVPDMDVTAPATLTAVALADAARAVDATLVFASPAALRNVVATADALEDDGRRALAGVRLLMSAGAPVPADLLRSAGALLPAAEPHTPYGMTEALPVADISLAGIEAAGVGEGVCVGRPVEGVDVTISPMDPLGHAEGELTSTPQVSGEVCVRAAHVKDHYDRLWATERSSSRTRGWHRSGDVGHLDTQGRLWIEGRLVHVITTMTGPVTPVGIERRVEGIEHVRLAAAVGVGPPGVQQVVVVVETDPFAPRPGLAPRSLTHRVRASLDVPVAAVLVVPHLPVDIRHNSKIDRGRLARWADRVLAGGRTGAP